MKRILFFMGLLLIGLAVKAQRTDTLDNLYPDYQYYYQWWCDEWLDTTDAPLAFDQDKFLYTNLVYANYNYTKDSLQVLGVAVCAVGRIYNILSDSFPTDIEEYVVLYDAQADSCPLVARAPIEFNVPHRSLLLHERLTRFPTDGTGGLGYGCSDFSEGDVVVPLYEAYFDTPVVVRDSFYVGITRYYYQSFHWDDFEVLGFRGAADWSWPGVPGIYPNDTCRNVPDMQYLVVPNDSTTDFSYERIPVFKVILPIIGGCSRVSNMRMTSYRQSDSTVSVSWRSDDYAVTEWELSYGLGDIQPEDGTVIPCSSPSATLHHIIPDTTYKVWVRAMCVHGNTSFWGDWASLDIRYHADSGEGGGEGEGGEGEGGEGEGGEDSTGFVPANPLDMGVSLRPNPAQDVVMVSASCSIVEVELFDNLGRQVLKKQGQGEEMLLDVSQLATGTYLVRIATTQGTIAKHLVIE